MLRRITLVEEIEHLLGDDIGRLTQPLEDAEVLEDRRHDLTEACELGLLRERVDQRPATTRLGRQMSRVPLGALKDGSATKVRLPVTLLLLRVFLSAMHSQVPVPGI